MTNALARGIFSAVAFAAVAGLCAYRYVSTSTLAVLMILAATLGYVEVMREKTVELWAGNLEFETIGYFLGLYRCTKKSVPRTDIRWLEHRDESGGGEVPYEPSGLYAELKMGATCILPHLDKQETDAVIAAIYGRFPDMLEENRMKRSPFGRHFTTLEI